MEELKPCPFCGGKAELTKCEYGDNTGHAFVLCRGCGSMTKKFNKSLNFCAVEEATQAWNRRVKND